MIKFYYLRGALGEAHLLEEHQKAIRELLNGSYITSDLEKLKGHDVYSFRTSLRARLLFSLRKISGQSYLIVLDFLANHEYDKSRFLKSGVLKHYIEQHKAEHERMAQEGLVFEALDEVQHQAIAAMQTPAGDTIDATELDYYQQQMIELNVNQREAINVPLPAIISGVAGSGKSCVSLSLLVSYLNAHPEVEESPLHLLYVTKSRRLVQTIETMWRELPLAQEHATRIQFKTYDDLLPEEVSDFSRKGETDFQAWYQKFIEHQKKVARAKQHEVPALDATTLYQELRIACAYHKEAYLRLGERQSALPASQRAWLYEVYEAYCLYLKEKNQLDPALYQWKNDKKYSLVVVDEAQDLSHWQLMQLGELAQEKSIVYCLDNHQRLFDRRSVRPFLLEYFHIGDRSHIELNVTYRCPVKIIAAANLVIAFKQRLAGGIGDKYEATQISASAQEKDLGYLYVLKPEQLQESLWLLEQALKPFCAIVTAKEHIKEAHERFATPLIFTPEEIKGLEYPIIIVYKLYKPALFHEAHKRLTELGREQPNPRHRPKAGAQDERFGPELNGIYTAYTRAQQLLVLCEPAERHYDLLLNPLIALANKEPLSEQCLHIQQQADWETQMKIQLDAGNDAIAKAIFTTKLGKTAEEFCDFLISHRAQTTAPPQPEAELGVVALAANASTPAPSVSQPKQLKPLARDKKGKISEAPPSLPEAPHPTQITSALSPKTETAFEKEAKQIHVLLADFTQRRLATIISLYGEHIWLQSYPQEGHPPIILADLLKDEVKRKIFSSCLVNNKKALVNIPFTTLLAHFKSGKYSELRKLLTELQAFQLQWQKVRLDPSPDLHCDELIHCAARYGICKQLLRLSELGADLDKSNSIGYTPAHLAVENGRIDVLRILQKLGADLNKTTAEGTTLAHVAAVQGYAGIFSFLHELGVALDQADELGETPAHKAAHKGDAATLRTLGELGANLDKVNIQGNAPVHYAAEKGHIEILHVLHKFKVNLDQINSDDYTPVHIAVQMENIAMLRALKELGANLNQETVGTTPVFSAAQAGKMDILRFLIEGKADLRKKTRFTKENLIQFSKHYNAAVRERIKLRISLEETGSESSAEIELSPLEIATLMGHTKAQQLISQTLSLSSTDVGFFSSPKALEEHEKPSQEISLDAICPG